MKVKLKEVRLSFPDLFTAVEYQVGDGKPRFNATFLLEPGSENDKAVRAAIQAVAEEAYLKKAPALLKQWEGNSQKFCYLDGNTKEYDGYADMMYLSAHTKTKPLVIDRNPQVKLTAQDGKPYAGCYVNASVEIYAQKEPNPGVGQASPACSSSKTATPSVVAPRPRRTSSTTWVSRTASAMTTAI